LLISIFAPGVKTSCFASKAFLRSVWSFISPVIFPQAASVLVFLISPSSNAMPSPAVYVI